MAGSNSDDSEGIVGINVTPLVDVMLVLLIIFMVTANYVNNSAIKIQLPKAATGEDAGVTNLAFVVDKESKIYLNGAFVDEEEMVKQILRFKGEGKPLQAIIGADKAAPYGAVIKVIDVLRQNGIFDFSINIEING